MRKLKRRKRRAPQMVRVSGYAPLAGWRGFELCRWGEIWFHLGMPISWNEIRHNAIKFSREWAGVKSESAEKQTFWNEFFEVFGIKWGFYASH